MRRARRMVCRGAEPDVPAVVCPVAVEGIGHRGTEAEHGKHRAHRECDLHRRGKARRLRRPAPRRPICAARGRNSRWRSARSSRPSPPIDPLVAWSASRTVMRVPRRIAGSAASTGPSRPSATLAASTGTSTPRPGSMAKNSLPKNRTSAFASASPSATPASVPSAPSMSAVRTYTAVICRRLAPIAFIVAISPVCSPTSAVIVLATRTSAESSARIAMMSNSCEKSSSSCSPGHSPGPAPPAAR